MNSNRTFRSTKPTALTCSIGHRSAAVSSPNVYHAKSADISAPCKQPGVHIPCLGLRLSKFGLSGLPSTDCTRFNRALRPIPGRTCGAFSALAKCRQLCGRRKPDCERRRLHSPGIAATSLLADGQNSASKQRPLSKKQNSPFLRNDRNCFFNMQAQGTHFRALGFPVSPGESQIPPQPFRQPRRIHRP